MRLAACTSVIKESLRYPVSHPKSRLSSTWIVAKCEAGLKSACTQCTLQEFSDILPSSRA